MVDLCCAHGALRSSGCRFGTPRRARMSASDVALLVVSPCLGQPGGQQGLRPLSFGRPSSGTVTAPAPSLRRSLQGVHWR